MRGAVLRRIGLPMPCARGGLLSVGSVGAVGRTAPRPVPIVVGRGAATSFVEVLFAGVSVKVGDYVALSVRLWGGVCPV
jgi:hypothetical protein